jgi:hypothetical protein
MEAPGLGREGFYTAGLRHRRFAIVLSCYEGQYELAALVRRLLQHPQFDTYAKRAGRIIRIAPNHRMVASAATTRSVYELGSPLLASCESTHASQNLTGTSLGYW